jgi:hypothetical protein
VGTVKTLKLRKSKTRPGKREADLAGVIISEGTARDIERRAKLAGCDVATMTERLLVIAATVVPDDPEEWDEWTGDAVRMRVQLGYTIRG